MVFEPIGGHSGAQVGGRPSDFQVQAHAQQRAEPRFRIQIGTTNNRIHTFLLRLVRNLVCYETDIYIEFTSRRNWSWALPFCC